MFIIFSKQC